MKALTSQELNMALAALLIENNAGNLQLRVWADINKEDPTHVISLQGAKNEMRQE
ncbi:MULTISPECIES: hypothetical protein [Vibrionaceae]|jgi:hypothetical protein|uniref:hypothetical protein n=1 Tax=Vibrionaceae TaxID=641 RepID=UPI00129404E5|nr:MULTISPECIES: hypothetical protein [Vibrionaceae]EHR0228475.1 hypothetical protein [Vibrio parahaemolyticus]HDY8061200.1 hypothetical protein [Vibrio vulnificus]EIU6822383.1 hypothetical protein [Vibrio parahaemolyticus]EIU6870024.1 hypothetical protein [Vibrio parahaemolyticus]MDF5082518.1 hypothetical protein [Vibrio parahaemolyticus]